MTDIDSNIPVNETTPINQTPPVSEPVEEEVDVNKLRLDFLNEVTRQIFDRIDPDEIAYLIKVDPSGKGSGGNNPFDVFGKAAGGGGGGTPGV